MNVIAMDVGALEKFNPWWVGEGVPPGLLGTHRRPYFEEAAKYIDKRFIVLLYGLRRVGKSTILYQLADMLLKKGINPLRVLYFSFDEQPAQIEQILSAYEEKVIKGRIGGQKTYLFLDEVQKVGDWQSKLKVLYDLNPDLKIFVSGSASISLQKKAAESLAGRVVDVHVKPLSFREFLQWKGAKMDESRPELYQKEASLHLADYMRKGGFPEITDHAEDGMVRKYVKSAVLDRILYRDIPQEFGVRDLELLRALHELFAREPGMIANVEGIAKDLGRNRITVANYIEYLKHALLICDVKNLRGSALATSRKNKKIYPTSPAFTFAMREDFFSGAVLSKVAETLVAAHLEAEYYYRNSFEVDFVKKKGKVAVPVEVKFGKVAQGQALRFMEIYKSPRGVVVSKDEFSPRGKVKVVPLWLFLMKSSEAAE